MGVAPLPFDPRSPCFCHSNCPGFERPTSRWWCVWTDPPATIPLLGIGVLVEFTTFVPQNKRCIFEAVVLPPLVTTLFFSMRPTNPIPGVSIFRRVDVLSSEGNSFANISLDNEKCNIPLNIPGIPAASPFGSVNIFPVRWFEDADDVPH